MLNIAECVHLACVLEATARKPGNVHPGRDFDDLTYRDFILSAGAIAPILERAPQFGVGPVVLDAIRATRRLVTTNTNLGIVLLLAPLAAVPRERDLRAGVGDVLNDLDIDDSRAVFAAIRLANPGGLGNAPREDIRAEPTLPLREIMALAADRDLVARQYANNFRDVLEIGVPALSATTPLEAGIIRCYLRLLSAHPDSHVARKNGRELAVEASRRAADVLAGIARIEEFDDWLCADGHRRNPGTTADLVAASLFAGLRDGIIQWPAHF